MLDVFGAGYSSGVPLFHTVGNHCLPAGRGVALPLLLKGRFRETDAAFYRQDLAPTNVSLLVLDTQAWAVEPLGVNSREWRSASDWLAQNSERLPNAVKWNGGVTRAQLMWLDKQLRTLASEHRRGIVVGHHPLVSVKSPRHTAWNGVEVLNALKRHTAAVICYLCGHFHEGEVIRDATIAPFPLITSRGMVESYPRLIDGLVFEFLSSGQIRVSNADASQHDQRFSFVM